MKRALFLSIVACLAMSTATCQLPVRRSPKQYKVAEVDNSGSVSADGRFLVYADWDTDQLYIRDLKTGEDRRLTDKVNSYKLSRDGRQVAYGWANDDGSYVLSLIGVEGSGARLVYRGNEIPWMELQDWSPNGKHILAVVSKSGGGRQVQLISATDGSVQVLQNLPDWRLPRNMRFSPDGRYIACDLPAQEESPSRGLFVFSADGTQELSLVEHSTDDLFLGWTPNGKGLLFATDHNLFATDHKRTWDAWVIQVADGTARGSPKLVKADIGPIEHGLGLTRDGSYYYGVSTWVNDVYLTTFDPATGRLEAPKKLANHVGFDTSVEWSPDGRYLAYAFGEGSDRDPFVLGIRSVETGKDRQIRISQMTRLGDREFQPRWSPDGRSFIAQGKDRSLRQSLFRIDAQTGHVTPLVADKACPTYMDCLTWPVWSPDGKAVFVRWTTRGRSVLARDVEIGREKELYRPLSPDDHVSRLTISPDGQRLAFVRWDAIQRTTSLEVMPASGGESRKLVDLSPRAPSAYWDLSFALAWSPDSRHIIYATSTGDDEQTLELWRIPADGGEPLKLGLAIRGLKPYGLTVHPDGRRIAFTAGTPRRSEVWVLKQLLPPFETAK